MGVGFNTAIVNWFRRQRGKALGIGFSGGALSGPFVVIVVWLEATYGWRESALILGAGMLLLGIPCAMLIRSKPSDMGMNPDGDSDAEVAAMGNPVEGGMTSMQALRDRNFWLLALIYGVLMTGISGFMLHQIPYLVSLGFSREAGAASLGVMTLVSLLGRVLGGMLMDYLSRRDLRPADRPGAPARHPDGVAAGGRVRVELLAGGDLRLAVRDQLRGDDPVAPGARRAALRAAVVRHDSRA